MTADDLHRAPADDAGHVVDVDNDRLEALAEFAAGAGHEINNPLATISGRVQMLLRDETDPERRRALATIGGQAYRIRDMIGDLMLFARPPRPVAAVCDLSEALADVMATMEDAVATRGMNVVVNAASGVVAWADRTQLKIVIGCLLQNSIDASPDGATIQVDALSIDDVAGTFALLRITDFGAGLDEKDRRHLFDPFYSGRQAGRGLGFGLSKCWRIVTNHGGRIAAASKPGQKTTFEVYWPSSAPPS